MEGQKALIAVAVRRNLVKSSSDLSSFVARIVEWFSANRREFPWRVGMLSEWQAALTAILLRKTRAETVAKHYKVIISSLSAPEKAVEMGVQGIEQLLRPLGLHRTRAAQIYKLAKAWGGGTRLPGLGPYAKSLIDCLVHGKPVPVMDVNTFRVLSRVFGVSDFKEARELLERAVIEAGTCELNLALMDFSAKICRARKPRCGSCPLRAMCLYVSARAERV